MIKRSFRILEFSRHNAAENMAIDEAIFRLYKEFNVDTIRFYNWCPSAVSIGKNQSVSDEVNLVNIKKLGFECIRRISGGGAVFHDQLGELTYSIVTKKKNLSSSDLEKSYYDLSEIVFHPLKKLGLKMEFNRIHCPSIFSGGKKISGNAQARSGDIVLQHGTLLVDYRPEIMYSVLKARPGRSTESMVNSVYQHITTLKTQLSEDLSPESVALYLTRELIESKEVDCKVGKLISTEKRLVQELLSTKYQSNDWVLSG